MQDMSFHRLRARTGPVLHVFVCFPTRNLVKMSLDRVTACNPDSSWWYMGYWSRWWAVNPQSKGKKLLSIGDENPWGEFIATSGLEYLGYNL